MIILVFGTIMLLLMVGGLISLFLIYQKRLLNKKYELQEMEIELQRRVMAAIIDTQEIERKRLAEDMHDELGALIMALKLGNHTLLMGESNDDRVRMLERNEALIEDIANRVRNVSHNLLPSSLKSGHFEDALFSLCTMLSENSSVEFCLHRDEKNVQINLQDRTSLYRVINEWLTNIIKHSRSKKVDVEIHKNGSFYKLDVIDDGSVFDFEKARSRNKGLGLVSMEGRLRQMNAAFDFKSNEQKGTTFQIRYPIQMNQI